jgi:hypothetical protein
VETRGPYTRAGKFTKDDKENDERRNPGVKFIRVYDLVPKESNEEGCHGDDEYTTILGQLTIHSMQKLRTND